MIDYLTAGEPKKIESVRIETPMGNIESDSGNDLIDLISVLFIIVIVLLFKKLWNIKL